MKAYVLQVRVLAVDDGTPPRTSTATLSVTVLDVNDNAPQFADDHETVVTITEGDSPRVVTVLRAQDVDNHTAGHGPPFTFQLDPHSSQLIQSSFRVDQQTSKLSSLYSFS